MINRSIVLKMVEERMDLYGFIDEVCLEIDELQNDYAFESGDFVEKELVNYYYWNEINKNEGWIRLVDDFSIQTQYIDVSVPTQELSELVISVLKKHVPVKDVAELKAEAREAGDDPEKANAFSQLGLGVQGSFDQEIKDILENALQSGHENIRTAATMSIFLLKWPQFKEGLERAIVVEEDMDLRAKMAYALAFCVAGK